MESDPTAEAPLICAECGRAPRQDENAADEWRAYADVDDELDGVLVEVDCRRAGRLELDARHVQRSGERQFPTRVA